MLYCVITCYYCVITYIADTSVRSARVCVFVRIRVCVSVGEENDAQMRGENVHVDRNFSPEVLMSSL